MSGRGPGPADDAPGSLALVRVEPLLADDLDRRHTGQLLYVGRDGEVKSPKAYRLRQLAAIALGGGMITAGGAYALMVAPLFVPVYAALGLRLAGAVNATTQLNRSAALVARGDLVGARRLAERSEAAWWIPRGIRASAALRLATIDALEGQHQVALERVRGAQRVLPRRQIQHAMSFYAEICLLAELGRLDEARAVLVARGGVPAGELLRVTYWVSEMYLAVAEGRLEIDDGALHERLKKGLSMTTGRDLLLLCAWVYATRDEHDEAVFAWRQARQREGIATVEVVMPKLAAWMTTYRAAHPGVETDEPEDDPYAALPQ